MLKKAAQMAAVDRTIAEKGQGVSPIDKSRGVWF
jgi:hypothetical protein